MIIGGFQTCATNILKEEMLDIKRKYYVLGIIIHV